MKLLIILTTIILCSCTNIDNNSDGYVVPDYCPNTNNYDCAFEEK